MSDPQNAPDELDVAELDDVAGGSAEGSIAIEHPELVVHEQ